MYDLFAFNSLQQLLIFNNRFEYHVRKEVKIESKIHMCKHDF